MKALRNRSGQATTEMILMIVVFMAVVSIVTAVFQKNNLIAKIVSGPWRAIAGMAQNGVWEDPVKSMNKHPNVYARWASVKGESPK